MHFGVGLVGVAAAAPATDLTALMTDDLGTGGGNNITAMTLWSWSRVYGAPMDKVVLPQAEPVINRLTNLCIERWFDTRRGPALALKNCWVNNLFDERPWQRLLEENAPGPLPTDIPVFLAQGSADGLVYQPAITEAYRAQLSGTAIRWSSSPCPGSVMPSSRRTSPAPLSPGCKPASREGPRRRIAENEAVPERDAG